MLKSYVTMASRLMQVAEQTNTVYLKGKWRGTTAGRRRTSRNVSPFFWIFLVDLLLKDAIIII